MYLYDGDMKRAFTATIGGVALIVSLLGVRTDAPASSRSDFDFETGVWSIDVHRLVHPFDTSKSWTHPCCYRHIVRKLWDGASLAQLEANRPNPHFIGLLMRLYDAKTGQWSVYWAQADSGAFDAPLVGTFAGGRGVFSGRDTVAGRHVLVRAVYSAITPTSFRTEQSLSTDEGKTWITTLVQTFTRIHQ